ncbi:MAG: hypothetical protein QOE45_171 [Frankiaceae bacterium]|nr:hypothetical protein [Frankiaceae bacterium]
MLYPLSYGGGRGVAADQSLTSRPGACSRHALASRVAC